MASITLLKHANMDHAPGGPLGTGLFTEPRRLDYSRMIGSVLTSASPLEHVVATGDPISERTRAVWSAGDYDRIAAGFRDEAHAFVDRLGLGSGQDVLDAACGSGNVTIPAAQAGARVTGLDLVPSLLDATAMWAAREGLFIRLHQGTVESLPYADASFDVVLSMFGVMFAARPERVAVELARVTRPGGRVALANWTREGFFGQLLATHMSYVQPPAGLASPLLWGDESVIRQRFNENQWEVSSRLRTLTFRYAYTPAGTAELFRTAYGPTVRAFEALDVDRRALLAADIEDHWTRDQAPRARTTEVDAEYREVIAVRR